MRLTLKHNALMKAKEATAKAVKAWQEYLSLCANPSPAVAETAADIERLTVAVEAESQRLDEELKRVQAALFSPILRAFIIGAESGERFSVVVSNPRREIDEPHLSAISFGHLKTILRSETLATDAPYDIQIVDRCHRIVDTIPSLTK